MVSRIHANCDVLSIGSMSFGTDELAHQPRGFLDVVPEIDGFTHERPELHGVLLVVEFVFVWIWISWWWKKLWRACLAIIVQGSYSRQKCQQEEFHAGRIT